MRRSRHFIKLFYGIYALTIIVSLVAIAEFKPSKSILIASLILAVGVVINTYLNRRKNYLSKDMVLEYAIVGLAVLIVLLSAIRH